jgi:DNA-binding MarR family transcriptional regulator
MQVVARLARQCGLPDFEGCVTLFTLMAASHVVDTWLTATIRTQGIPKVKMYAMVTLLALHPASVGRAELAGLLSSDPAVVADALDALIGDGLAVRCPAPDGAGIRLTPDGLERARQTVLPILGILHDCAVELTLRERHQLAQACTHISAYFPSCP